MVWADSTGLVTLASIHSAQHVNADNEIHFEEKKMIVKKKFRMNRVEYSLDIREY